MPESKGARVVLREVTELALVGEHSDNSGLAGWLDAVDRNLSQ